MASRGSVIPLFNDLIESGQPITITNPRMTRYLMTLDEAVDLVLYAFQYGTQGDLLVQKAPACTIGDLAEAMMESLGRRVDSTIIGSRHGENCTRHWLRKRRWRVQRIWVIIIEYWLIIGI
jgi:UDP-N-acetylglucosamine 4,6-dehydratase